MVILCGSTMGVIETIRRIYRHFDTLPSSVELHNSRFYMVANLAQTLAWIAHLTWSWIFLLLNENTMAGVQWMSILFYVTAIILNRHAYHMASMIVSLIEINAHQLFAVYYLGSDLGFQYFIPAVAIFPFLIPGGSRVIKFSLLGLCTTCFLIAEVLLSNHAPVSLLSSEVTRVFHFTNTCMSFAFIGLWAYYLNVAIYRGEIILAKRTKELAAAEHKAEQAAIEHELNIKERDNEIFRLRNIELRNSYNEIVEQKQIIEEERNKSRSLLLNILPEKTADELLNRGKASIHHLPMATVLFSDFCAFTELSSRMHPEELVTRIDEYFRGFDEIMIRYGIEKIKTIGDAYMAVSGLQENDSLHVENMLKAAGEMIRFTQEKSEVMKDAFQIRIGIHCGPLVSGVVGQHKFQFDVWGDTVNTAARMEQLSEPGRITVSEAVKNACRDAPLFIFRGEMQVKGKGLMPVYFAGY